MRTCVKQVGWCAVVLVAAMATSLNAASLAERYFDDMKQPGNAKAAPAAVTASAITEIAMQRTGAGPDYAVTIAADGTVRYEGRRNTARLGVYAGTLPVAEFSRLADTVIRSGFFSLNAAYKSSKMDMPSVYTSVKAGATDKIVMNYGDKGPAELVALEQAIDAALQTATLVKQQ